MTTDHPYRYGVFLQPDPATCWAVTALTNQLRAQYGLVSAGAFPPHATLVGSQHLVATEATIIDAVTRALAGVSEVTAHNAGIARLGRSFVYDVAHLADGEGVNSALTDLALAVDRAVAPLRRTGTGDEPPSDDVDLATFSPHLSLASHDLPADPDLREEVWEYLHGLPVQVPARFTARTIALIATLSDDWSGRWWQTLTWRHVRSWRLAAAGGS